MTEQDAREWQDRQHEAVMAIQRAVEQDGRTREFLTIAAAAWPRLEGAGVADVLDILHDHDAMLDKTEPFFEAHAGELPDVAGTGYAAYALLVLGEELTVPGVLGVLRRAGLWKTSWLAGYDHGLAGRASDSGSGPARDVRDLRYKAGYRAGATDRRYAAEHAARAAGDVPLLTQVDPGARAQAADILRAAGESLGGVRHELLTAGERTSPPPLEVVAGWFSVIQGEVAKARALVVPGSEVYITRTGRVITEDDLDAWVAEAERGYVSCPQCGCLVPSLADRRGHKMDCTQWAVEAHSILSAEIEEGT